MGYRINYSTSLSIVDVIGPQICDSLYSITSKTDSRKIVQFFKSLKETHEKIQSASKCQVSKCTWATHLQMVLIFKR